MNISKIILMGSFVSLVFASCANDEFLMTEAGTMSLSVDKVAPTTTRVVDTDEYPVAIYSLTNNQEIASYERADLVPAKIKPRFLLTF